MIQQLKKLAAESRESMSRIANRLLRQAVERERAASRERGRTWVWHVVPGGRPAPGFDPASRDYLDLLDTAP